MNSDRHNKFLIQLSFGIGFIFGYLVTLIKMIILLPVTAFLAQRKKFSEILSQLKHDVRKHLPYFDSNGLKHNIDHINSIRVEEFIHLPLEDQAKYSDIMAHQFCKSGQEAFSNEGSEIDYANINVTGIGNAAYVCLNHPLMSEREKAHGILNKIEYAIRKKF